MTKEPLQIKWVEKIFMRLHGRFGNAFFDKFRIGQLNQAGQDIGIENAKIVWSEELSGVTPEGLSQALSASYEYAPSCDDFKANCVVRQHQPIHKALPRTVDAEHNKAYADNVINYVAENIKPKRDLKDWARKLISGEVKSNCHKAIDYAKEALATA
jgi:hypothetical protein